MKLQFTTDEPRYRDATAPIATVEASMIFGYIMACGTEPLLTEDYFEMVVVGGRGGGGADGMRSDDEYFDGSEF